MSSVIATRPGQCRRCHSCIRRCPAKAIRVHEGQAEVIEERCIACGRCLSVCPRGARAVNDTLPRVRELIAAGNAVLMLAPTFPAAFPWLPGQVVAAARRLGFAAVNEVAFGAELVGRAYRRANDAHPDWLTITSACPAAVGYVQDFAPNLIPYLAQLHSPMTALGKALKSRLRPGCTTVFVGPCTAKIKESQEPDVAPWVDAATVFADLRRLFEERGVDPSTLEEELPDPPLSGSGGAFPLPGGLLRTAGLPQDVLESRIHLASGLEAFMDTIDRLAKRVECDQLHGLEARFFDVLFCDGCVAGPAFESQESSLARRESVVRYLRSRPRPEPAQSEAAVARLATLDLYRRFEPIDRRPKAPSEAQIREILALTGKLRPEDELNCRACGYRSCREKAVAVFIGIAELDMCLPHLVERLEATVSSLNRSREQLTEAQAQLIRSERLASMGQLAAGIAHELNNPLGTILIYAHLVAKAGGISDQLRGDVDTILREVKRCKGITSGLLDFARQNEVRRSEVRVSELVDAAVNATRAQAAARGSSCTFVADIPADLPVACIDRDQMLQVLLNLLQNAVDVMPSGGVVTTAARWLAQSRELVLSVSDTGPGIATEHASRLFNPFFTTKPVGRGTGLGLPICYGIVKMHRGTITARNNAPAPGATFEVRLPAESPAMTPPPKESTHAIRPA
jgi:two-component system, NtrC family, sensor kinase